MDLTIGNLGKMKLLTHLNYVNIVAKTGSIRKAAEQLNITSTALNRRILALEEELGGPIFERLPQGVRLNVAGELVIQHIRKSMADLSKVTSQIADLSGVRRGHIKLAGGSEVIGRFLPGRIASYREDHAHVSFEILRRNPEQAMRALQDYDADLSFIFGPVPATEFQILASVMVNLGVMVHHSHPLAEMDVITIDHCFDYPAILPAEGTGLYQLLYHAQAKTGISFRQAVISESYDFMFNYSQFENAITFMLPLDAHDSHPSRDYVIKPLKANELVTGRLHLTQLKGRVLPVASAKFAENIIQYFNENFPENTT